MPPPSSSEEVHPAVWTSLVRWYAAMGVDLALDEVPHDRFAESARPAPAPPSRKPTAPPPAAARLALDNAGTGLDTVARSARDSAGAATTLDELRERLLAFEGCGLKATATQLVFGTGNPNATIMFIGEAPGAEEDRSGIPFVGRAGQLLDKMLAAIGIAREAVYIANIVPWRPPGNRTPTPLETAACLPFIRRQIELVGPRLLVCLGAPSTQTLLGVKEGITRLRGRALEYRGDHATLPAFAMLHPAYLLRQPSQKKLAWADLRQLAKAHAGLFSS